MLMPMPMVTMLIFSNGQSLVNQKAKLGISISTLVLAYSNSEIVANFRLEAWNIIRKKWRKKYPTENWPKFLKELPCRMESILNETAVLAYSECIDNITEKKLTLRTFSCSAIRMFSAFRLTRAPVLVKLRAVHSSAGTPQTFCSKYFYKKANFPNIL